MLQDTWHNLRLLMTWVGLWDCYNVMGCVQVEWCVWIMEAVLCMRMGVYVYGWVRIWGWVYAYKSCACIWWLCECIWWLCVCIWVCVYAYRWLCIWMLCVYAYVSCVIWWEEEEYENNNDVKTAYDAFPLHALPGCLWVHCCVHHHEIELSVSFNCSSPPPFHYFGWSTLMH